MCGGIDSGTGCTCSARCAAPRRRGDAAAPGPRVHFVGLNHYNPYLTKGTKEGVLEAFAANSVTALTRMNRVFDQVYGSFHIPVADVEGAFHEDNARLKKLAGDTAYVADFGIERAAGAAGDGGWGTGTAAAGGAPPRGFDAGCGGLGGLTRGARGYSARQ